MAIELKSVSSDIHFTLPESLWEERSDFFKSFGFVNFSLANRQYRRGEDEFHSKTRFDLFWQKAVEHIPTLFERVHNMARRPQVSMTVVPRFAKALFNGKAIVAIRKAFSPRWVNQRLSLCSSLPNSRLYGEATVSAVDSGNPVHIWRMYGRQTQCSKEEFDRYTLGAKNIFAVRLCNSNPSESSTALTSVEGILRAHSNHARFEESGRSYDQRVSLTEAIETSIPPILV
jgi:predicted transcriptional regulator